MMTTTSTAIFAKEYDKMNSTTTYYEDGQASLFTKIVQSGISLTI